MRRMYIALIASILWLAGSTCAQAGCAGCGSRHCGGLDAEPGFCPGGFTWVPGCCEDRRPCCDNAWAGYCEHRAKVDAFWSRVGTGSNYGRRYRPGATLPCDNCLNVPTNGYPTPAAAPRAAVPLSPIPAPPVPDNTGPKSPAR